MISLVSITQTAATVTRQMLRPPLTAIDDRVVRPRLGDDSPVHRALTTALGLLDSLADVTPPTSPDRSASEPDRLSRPEQHRVEDLTEELLTEQQDERFVGELNDDDELRRVQAQVRAKQLIEDPEHP